MKILFIQTGGTIDKDYPRVTKGYAFEITEPAVKRITERINPNFEYKIVALLQKDSLDLTKKDRAKILGTCSKSRANKIIITHGTDTLIQTAKTLSKIKNKTIILTGAMRPEKFSDSDATFNVGVAVGALGSLKHGIYIAMNGRVYDWKKCKRISKTGQFIYKD